MIGQILVSSVVMGLIGFIAWYSMISIGVEENTAQNLAVLHFLQLENGLSLTPVRVRVCLYVCPRRDTLLGG